MKSIACALCLGILATTPSALAQTPPGSTPLPDARTPQRPRRWLLHVNASMNAYTYLGATATAASAHLTPDKRVSIGEQIGVGYFFHPNLSARLTFQFGETLTGLPSGASPFTLFGAIPWLVFSTGGFYAGAGPMVDFVTYGKAVSDVGFYAATGYAFALGRGFSLGVGVNTITMFVQRTYVALNVITSLVWRF